MNEQLSGRQVGRGAFHALNIAEQKPDVKGPLRFFFKLRRLRVLSRQKTYDMRRRLQGLGEHRGRCSLACVPRVENLACLRS
jgi:hypothetical protein